MNHLKDYEYLILLQPTSPLRTSQHINLACKKIIETNADSLLSVKEIPNEILKVLIEDSKGNLKSGFNKEFPFMPRQELPNAYLPNGAIYISKVSSFIKSHSLLATKNTFMIMDDDSSNDIDNLDDIITTESIFKKNEYKKKSKPA
jgi:N-acylneuraminate cytidylyltransferase